MSLSELRTIEAALIDLIERIEDHVEAAAAAGATPGYNSFVAQLARDRQEALAQLAKVRQRIAEIM